MYKGLAISSGFHFVIFVISFVAIPFVAKKPLDIPPIVSVELIQIAEQTNIPYAPKASKIIEKIKKDNEKLLSEQAPPKKVKKDKKKEVLIEDKKEKISKLASKKTPTINKKDNNLKEEKLDAVPLPDKEKQIIETKEEKNQKPSKEINDENIKKIVKLKKPKIDDKKIKQVSEF